MGTAASRTNRAAYSAARHGARMRERLLDHLGIERADVIGYSMGARIAAFLALGIRSGCGARCSAGSGRGW